jgi:chromate transport protein ChrA
MVFIEALGVLCVGIVVMWLVWYFVTRFKEFSVQVLSSLVAIVFAGVVLQFVQLADKTDFWYYPIGLLLGLVLYGINSRFKVMPVLKMEKPS